MRVHLFRLLQHTDYHRHTILGAWYLAGSHICECLFPWNSVIAIASFRPMVFALLQSTVSKICAFDGDGDDDNDDDSA